MYNRKGQDYFHRPNKLVRIVSLFKKIFYDKLMYLYTLVYKYISIVI